MCIINISAIKTIKIIVEIIVKITDRNTKIQKVSNFQVESSEK